MFDFNILALWIMRFEQIGECLLNPIELYFMITSNKVFSVRKKPSLSFSLIDIFATHCIVRVNIFFLQRYC